jgi:hypothetical protein
MIMQGYLMLQMNKEAKKYRLKLRDEILPKVKSEKMKEKIKKVIAW